MTEVVFVLMCLLLIISNLVVSWAQNVYFNITEEQGKGYYIGNIADSADLQADITFRFSLLSNGYPLASKFSVDEASGNLITSESLDRDNICAFAEHCVITLGVVAQSDSAVFLNIKVFVNLLDLNDNSPVFKEESFRFSVTEGAPVNTSFPLEGATDKDAGIYGVVKYEIVPSNGPVPFEVRMDTSQDGRLNFIISGIIDREIEPNYHFQVLAYDGGDPPNMGSLMVSVSIADVNDNYPKFTQTSYNNTINDDSPVNTVITRVFATDLDDGENGLVKYRLSSLQSEEIVSTFGINETSGEVYLKQSLISRSKEYYRIIVEASDSADQPLIAQSLVFVRVLDRHNNFPEININLLSNKPHAEISEHASKGAAVAHVAVSDPDTGDNGLVTCNIQGQIFKLQKFDTNEYKVVVFASLDRENVSKYDIVVLCTDTGNPPKATNATFELVILDENDNLPIFAQSIYRTAIFENNDIGLSLIEVSANDLDIDKNGQIEYSLLNDLENTFSIDNKTGQITVQKVLDREKKDQYNLIVFGADMGNPSLTGTGTVNVVIKDVNDNEPKFPTNVYKMHVLENSPSNTIVGEVKASDIDENENSNISYRSSANNDELPFVVIQNGSVLVSVPLDREETDVYTFHITANDQGNPSLNSSTEVVIKVDDENDNDPIFVFPKENNNTISISYKTPTNSVVGVIKAVDNDTGLNSKLSFYFNNDNISNYLLLNSYNGEIFLIKELSVSDIGNLIFEVTVEDHGQPKKKAVQNMTLYIRDHEPDSVNRLDRNVVVVIAISCITVFLALLILFMIFLLRRQGRNTKNKLHESQESESQSQKIGDGEEAGFIRVTSPVYYPPTYSLTLPETYTRPPPPSYSPPQLPKTILNTQKFNTIQRSISVQQEIKVQGNKSFETSSSPGDAPLWEESEMNDSERQRNQRMIIEYQRSLLRIQQCKRSNSVLTI